MVVKELGALGRRDGVVAISVQQFPPARHVLCLYKVVGDTGFLPFSPPALSSSFPAFLPLPLFPLSRKEVNVVDSSLNITEQQQCTGLIH